MASVHLERNKQYKHFIYNTIIKSISNPIHTEVDKHPLTCSSSKYLGCMDALAGASAMGAAPEAHRKPMATAQEHPHSPGARAWGPAVERKRFLYLSRTPNLRSAPANQIGGSAVRGHRFIFQVDPTAASPRR